MTSFKDNMNQDWTLNLTLSKTRKLREKLGLDLLNPQHYLQVLNSLTDRLAFVYLLCEDQAKQYEVSIDEFEERLYGDGFSTSASMAFLEETESFFRKLGQSAMETLARKSIQSMTAGQARVAEMMSSGQFDSLLDRAQSEMESLLPGTAGAGL